MELDPPKLDLYIEGYELTVGKVKANSQPEPVNYRSAKSFLSDPEVSKILNEYHSCIIGKFLWNEWTFDLDLNLYFDRYDEEKFENDFYVLYEKAINKHKILIDVSLVDKKEFMPSHLPQKNEIVYDEQLSKFVFDIQRTCIRYVPRETKIKKTVINPYSPDGNVDNIVFNQTENNYLSSTTILNGSQKVLKQIYDSKKDYLTHSLEVKDFLEMTEEQFNKIKNY
jgi:hypothetical protein